MMFIVFVFGIQTGNLNSFGRLQTYPHNSLSINGQTRIVSPHFQNSSVKLIIYRKRQGLAQHFVLLPFLCTISFIVCNSLIPKYFIVSLIVHRHASQLEC